MNIPVSNSLALLLLRVGLAVGAVWFVADALYEAPDQPEPYSIVALAPDPEPPADGAASFDGLAGCNGYVPALPTDECDGPPVPSNNETPPPPPPAAPSIEEPDQEEPEETGTPIPFASTETDVDEEVAPPVVTNNADGTKTVEIVGQSAADGEDEDGTGEPPNAITFTGEADEGEWNPGASFEVPGTDIVLVPADISAASTNTGGLEASVFGFEITVTAAPAEGDEGEEGDGDVSVEFDGIEFIGEWSEEPICYACLGEEPPEGAEGEGTLGAGGVFELPDGELILVPGTGADSESDSQADPESESDPESDEPEDTIVFADVPEGAVYLATLVDLENDGVFDVAFIAPEGGVEIDLEDPTG